MTAPNPDAIEAGAKALFGNDTLWDHAGPGHRDTAVRQAHTAYAAMEPHIRRQVAEELTATTGIHVRTEIRKILDRAGNFPSSDQLDAMAQEVIDVVVLAARLQERQQIAEDRCPSCDHFRGIHQADGCWHTVVYGLPGRDLVCACSLAFGHRTAASDILRASRDPQRHPRDETGRYVQNGETA